MPFQGFELHSFVQLMFGAAPSTLLAKTLTRPKMRIPKASVTRALQAQLHAQEQLTGADLGRAFLNVLLYH